MRQLADCRSKLIDLINRLPETLKPIIQDRHFICTNYFFQAYIFKEFALTNPGPCLFLVGGRDNLKNGIGLNIGKRCSVPVAGFGLNQNEFKLPSHNFKLPDNYTKASQLLSQKYTNETQSKSSVILSLEDSGSCVNLGPALEIAKALADRDIHCHTITESKSVEKEFSKAGFSVSFRLVKI